MKVFFFPNTFVEMISGLGDFISNYICPNPKLGACLGLVIESFRFEGHSKRRNLSKSWRERYICSAELSIIILRGAIYPREGK